MAQEIHHCKEINSKSVTFFFQRGTSKQGKKILILGESLAKNGWLKSGKAFYTLENKIVPTGKRLNKELSLIGVTFEECAFTEIAKCYLGKNRKILSKCGLLCANHLLKQINHYKPRLILSLGVITKEVLEKIFKKTLLMGKIKKITYKGKAYCIIPLYHPSPANPFGHAKNIRIIKDQKKSLKKIWA
ncbi:MAG: uracil-DNA glycosylase family protein [Patescibacteria group bacterium]